MRVVLLLVLAGCDGYRVLLPECINAESAEACSLCCQSAGLSPRFDFDPDAEPVFDVDDVYAFVRCACIRGDARAPDDRANVVFDEL